ncbi:MAG: molybdopterin molybdotransferase MoeA [Gemmataceae bacterium]|nr:molybdopterin molybdotransferase MoeA [Gemmataceae bacterium]
MVSVEEAQHAILEAAMPLAGTVHALSTLALGQVLAEDVASDLDQPPFDKAMMDGYAVRIADFANGVAELTVVEEITAGKTPTRSLGLGEAARIMTGAPIPHGCDAVVMVERSRMIGEMRVRLEEPKATPRMNVLSRGREMRVGETVLHAGTRLRPQELGLLASVGRVSASLIPRPAVAVIATGDEIVPADEKPGPGQIRNSNAPMLLGQAARAGALPRFVGIAKDEPDHLRRAIADGLKSDVLVLSGGVSAGKSDLVPSMLDTFGLQVKVRHVRMKPGKPLLFGIVPREGRRPALVFGLPGNPVSSLVCFELFARPALRKLMGWEPGPRLLTALLAEDTTYRTDRPTYHPAVLERTGSALHVRPVPWFGSADLRGVGSGNSFLLIAAGDHRFAAGTEMTVLATEDSIEAPLSPLGRGE